MLLNRSGLMEARASAVVVSGEWIFCRGLSSSLSLDFGIEAVLGTEYIFKIEWVICAKNPNFA
jgi:hypothetical protein